MVTSASMPVLTEEQATAVARKVLGFAKADTVLVELVHTANRVSRIANNRVLAGNDGDSLELTIYTSIGARSSVPILINQLDDDSLREAVRIAEAIALLQVGSPINLRPISLGPQKYL